MCMPQRFRGVRRKSCGSTGAQRAPAHATPMLTVENVDLFYGASQALRRVSIGATKGAVTCLLGRNGVGKTSLLRAIFGLQPIRGGRIEWDGTDLTQLAPHQRARRGLALVPQGR